eukprot:SAG22_NODE_71_length_22540_cov_8.918052_15_plen_1445_part_00
MSARPASPAHHESSRIKNITKLVDTGLNPDYGVDLQAQFDQHYAKKLEAQAAEANKVVHLEKKIKGPPTVLEEFAQLEKLYLGPGAPHEEEHPNDTVTSEMFAAALAAEEDEEQEEKIATEILFVQKQYLSKPRDHRLQIATEVAADAERWKRAAKGNGEDDGGGGGGGGGGDDDDSDSDGGKQQDESGRETSLEIRARMQMDLIKADLNAEQFERMLKKEGMWPGRAKQIASLTQDIKPKVSYQRGPDGVFTKFKGTGIPPPSHAELEIIQSVLAEARADKTGVTFDRSRMADPNKVHEFGWYTSNKKQLVTFDDMAIVEAEGAGQEGADDMADATKVPSPISLAPPKKAVDTRERYVVKLQKKVPLAEEEAIKSKTPKVCAFCGQRPGPADDWVLQQYFDDTVEPPFLTYAHFCERHNFERLLLRRPQTGVQIKSQVWSDLRRVAIYDRENLRNWRWCGKFWMTLFSIANISALIVAVVAIVVAVLDGRCSALDATSAETFTFDTASLRDLRVETTRGVINTRVVPAGSPLQISVTVAADRPATLALIRVASAVDAATGGAKLTVRHTRSNDAGQLRDGSTIGLTDCYTVSIDVDLPADATIASYAVDQRWSIHNCTIERGAWPFSMVPHQLLSECLVGGLVPEDPHFSILADLRGLPIATLDLSTNRGAVQARNVTTYGSLRVHAARGFAGYDLESKRFSIASQGGDIDVSRITFRQNESHNSFGEADHRPVATLSRGGGWLNTREDWETRGVTHHGRAGAVRIGEIEGVGILRIDGGTERTDVQLHLDEFKPWLADISSCGGGVHEVTHRLEPAPLPRPLPLICQRLFDNRIVLCKPFAEAARAAGDEYVDADFAGNGFCDTALNVDPCYDGGDCCATTCDTSRFPERCGVALNSTLELETLGQRVWNCTDKWAAENYGPLPDCGQILLDNDAYWGEQLGVWSRRLTNLRTASGSVSCQLPRAPERLLPTRCWPAASCASPPPVSCLASNRRPGPVLLLRVLCWDDCPPQASGADMLESGQAGENPWGWYSCAVRLGQIFNDRPVVQPSDSSGSSGNSSLAAAAAAGGGGPEQEPGYYPRSMLEVRLQQGDVRLDLTEALPFSDVWARHLTNKRRGWDCSLWGCTDIDECASSPCQHGGVCKDSLGLGLGQLSFGQRDALEQFELARALNLSAAGNNASGGDGSMSWSAPAPTPAPEPEPEPANASVLNMSNVSSSPAGPSIEGIAGMPDVAVGWYNCSCPPTYAGDMCEIAKEYRQFRIRSTGTADGTQLCVGELWFYGIDGERIPKIGFGATPAADIDLADASSIRITMSVVPNGTALQQGSVVMGSAGGNLTVKYAYSPWNVFDGSTSSMWCTWPDSPEMFQDDGSALFGVELWVDFREPVQLTKYALQANAASLAPTAWTLDAWDSEGGAWRTLHEQSGVTWARDAMILRYDVEAL